MVYQTMENISSSLLTETCNTLFKKKSRQNSSACFSDRKTDVQF